MGTEEYYRVLGQAVDDGEFARELKDARNDEELKTVVRNRARGIELDDQDLKAVQKAAKHLTEFPDRPGRKFRY